MSALNVAKRNLPLEISSRRERNFNKGKAVSSTLLYEYEILKGDFASLRRK